MNIHGIYRRPSNGVPAGDAIPFFDNGIFHLFHLASPPNTDHFPERVRCSWYHATSKNLITWNELPVALSPSDDAQAPDRDGVWTGSVIKYKDIYHIFYTGYSKDSKFPQTICHASSADGIIFEKDKNNPIICPDTNIYESIDWRDPYVFWNENESCFWMVISARLKNGPPNFRGCLTLAISTNLSIWTFQGPIYSPWNTYCLECPEIFRLGEYWYLVYSRFSESAQTLYRISKNPRGPWRVPIREGLDGRRWYAAKSAGSSEKRIAFGWVHEREGKSDDGTWEWGGDFCIPREFYSKENGELGVKVPILINNLYGQKEKISFVSKMGNWEIENSNISCSSAGLSYGFLDIKQSDYRLDLEIIPQEIQGKFGILLNSNEDLSSTHLLEFSPNFQRVSIVRWPEPLDAFWRDLTDRKVPLPDPDGPGLTEQPISMKNGKKIECSIFVSGTILEVFIDRKISMSYRIYTGGEYKLGLFLQNGQIEFTNIRLRREK